MQTPHQLTHLEGKQELLLKMLEKVLQNYLIQFQVVFFTSGGTESDNMAINCAIKDHEISHAITTKIEHHAVLYPLQQLEKAGNIKLSYVDVNSDGLICLESLEKILKNSSRSFVSIMHANNEIGTIQDISLIGDICKKYNAIFHSDTVQTVGHYPIDLKSLNVDFIAASAHKFHGPKGIGFIYISEKFKLTLYSEEEVKKKYASRD